jgi:hypothetical protein
MDFERLTLEEIAVVDPIEQCLLLRRRRDAEKFEIVKRGLNTADAIWFLFNALRDRIVTQGQEIAELRGRLEKPEGAKAKKGRKA